MTSVMSTAATGMTPRASRPATTPHTTTRTPYSVGQSHPNPRFSPSAGQRGGRSPSPNYFGLTLDSAKHDPLSSGGGNHARKNWSPPTSNVRSTAAVSPRVIPLDQNPEFEAFRRATEANGLNAVRMSSFGMGAPPALKPPTARRTSSKTGSSVSHNGPFSPSQIMLPPSPRTTVPGYETKFAENTQRSPKRMLSSPTPHITDRPRRNSPAGFNERDASLAPQVARFLEQTGRDSRHSMPPLESAHAPPSSLHHRADTLPGSLDDQTSGESGDNGPALVSSQFAYSLLDDQPDQILLLDVRVSTQYAKSRIKGALNLCIPTTLLKRPAYNTDRLSDTFKVGEQREKFDSWRTCKSIIVYDGNSTKMKDAGPCLKMLEKFENEGWGGSSYIIRGGFMEFSRKFPAFVAHGFEAGTSATVLSGDSIAPVIGGCPMPATENAANPFFNNIRQNQDLIGGVGQMVIQRPVGMSSKQKEELPRWLKRAISSSNEGKIVSDKFLNIEQKEQKRMLKAMSGAVNYGTPRPGDEQNVQLAGIEKGAKNRYNNIWPYEHSRVKLEGPLKNGCDYVNANHVKAQWSNKRYIATQGPIPATFADFWNVVWQQDVRVIVMLTAESENGQIKAHNYWSGGHYGSVNVHLHSEHRATLDPVKIREHRNKRPSANHRHSMNSSLSSSTRSDSSLGENMSPNSDAPYVTVRNLTISNGAEPFERMREVTQLHYTGWPDFGAPQDPSHLLGLVEQCDTVVRASAGKSSPSEPSPANERPVIVHCSAGCGRTGTFCTVDSVIDMVKRQMRDGFLSKRSVEAHRSARHPTPMEVDSKSRQTSFASVSSPTKKHAPQSFFASAPYGAEVHGDEWLQRDDVDLIEKAVEDFRLQRLSMVQSLRQYVLCYESVLEWLISEKNPSP